MHITKSITNEKLARGCRGGKAAPAPAHPTPARLDFANRPAYLIPMVTHAQSRFSLRKLHPIAGG